MPKRIRPSPGVRALAGAPMGAVVTGLRRSDLPWAGVAAVVALVAAAGAELAFAVLAVSHPVRSAVPNAALLFHGGLGADPLAVSRPPLLSHTFLVKRELFLALIAMSVCYLAVLGLARHVRVRWALAALVVAFAIVGLAPILLSKDAFLYVAYARLGALHHLNPYVHPPAAASRDAILRYIDWRRQVEPYGPVFTLATYPLGLVSIPAAVWILKLVAVVSGAAALGLVWKCAQRLRRPAVPAVLTVGLNPLFLLYGVGGAHNDLLMVMLLLGGLYLLLAARHRLGGAAVALAVGIKAAAAPLAPFALLASRRRGRAFLGAAIAVAGLAALTLAVFGPHQFGLRQQAATVDRYSLARLLASPFGVRWSNSCAEHLSGCNARALQIVPAAVLALTVALLLYRVWRGADPIAAAGWAALALIASLASVMAWYLVWALPMTALSRSRWLYAATAATGVFLLITTWPGRQLLLP
jgi:alpha-1,6-mannosyltransferase